MSRTERTSSDSIVVFGIAGSHGVAIGPAVVVDSTGRRLPLRRIQPDQSDYEWQRFAAAVHTVQDELRALIRDAPAGSPHAAILEAYLLMVADDLLAEGVRAGIHQSLRCADWAVGAAIDEIVAKLAAVGDPYLSERKHDVEFVGQRLLGALAGVEPAVHHLEIDEPCIVVAHDLSPADTAAMRNMPVLGFVTEIGSRTSHTAIMARALEIPAVVGLGNLLSQVESGQRLVVDGLRGSVSINPTAEQVEEARRRASRYRAMEAKLHERRDSLGATADGTRVELLANIELSHEAKLAIAHGAEGVGLYRTEFLYVDRSQPPTETDQLAQYRTVIEGMAGRPVTLRTFDLGGDKFTSTFQLPDELNPMLGLRAVRLQLTEPDVLLVHLRAMVRASADGDVRIMVPLVCTLDELVAVRKLLDQAMNEVVQAGEPSADSIPLGVMIEVPAAAVMADLFAQEADFLSIGTNDLVQYSLAIDRSNRTLAYLASPYHPSVLRLIDTVIRAGRTYDCPVSLCGEMGSEPYGALLAVGLGLRNLSMESVAIPEIKEALARVTLEEARDLANCALRLRTTAEVMRLLNQRLEARMHDLLTGQPDFVVDSITPPSDAPAAG